MEFKNIKIKEMQNIIVPEVEILKALNLNSDEWHIHGTYVDIIDNVITFGVSKRE